MSIFGWRKSLAISDQDPTYKVRYLGNVQTSMMKGDGCVDKPVSIIWNNYMRSSHPGLEMKLVVTASGLKAYTKEQGLTEYRAHRISYCIAHPNFPRVFVWVYRHEGKKMKMELRCHAVLCKTELKAKSMALQLHEKLSFALKEFQREKVRKQNSRLVLQRTNSLPKAGSVLPLRKQMLSTAENFKPSVSKSNTAPKLGAITEDHEESLYEEDFYACEADIEDIDENDNLESASVMVAALTLHSDTSSLHTLNPDCELGSIIDVEIGNNIDELRQNEEIKACHVSTDSDEESAESGFHDQEQDPRDGLVLIEEEEEEGGSVCELPCGDHLVPAIGESSTKL